MCKPTYEELEKRINDLKKTEEELHIEKTYLEALFNSAPEAIILHDHNDIVVNVNDEFTRMFGYSREEAIGKPINDLVASEEFEEHAAANSYMVIHGQKTDNECLEKANRLLFRSIDSKTFVSLFYGILDTKNNTMCYANAGQNLPLIFSPEKKPVPLKTHGLVLGTKEDVSYEKEEISINPGDRLLIYSDGIPEAMNAQMEEFGDENLLEIVQRYRDYSADALIENIIAALNLHFGSGPQNDDMTMVLLLRKALSV